MKTLIRPLLVIFVVLAALTGLAYPAVVMLVGQSAFHAQANGSLVEQNGKVVGSALIGQSFDKPGYFWGRLSATTPMPYNAANSGGSNLGPLNPSLSDQIKARIAALKDAGTDVSKPVPIDLVTASASGLDPEISPAAAEYQIGRVANARHLPADTVAKLVADHTTGRQFGVFGEPRVNVLKLNLALDAAAPAAR
ncbi:potassium-transporting ATPase subunit KdpC [Burkholderia guangdongensis]|uniref:potassium-transporting ATPase subunit KdpC n=1 Tax=Burkholderia guangdongensis TaxID=1792500 RepID=UPI0015C7E554|nr:potassium-transporting ATPase subunit KdpC [Burkholderia guangdongensis]